MLQELYVYILKAYGFQVVGIASNGKEAVNMFKSFFEKPDIVVMDHRMPIKNGFEASKEILQINDNTKIIFASADVSIRDEVLELGVCGFLKKPFTKKTLIDEISDILKDKN